MYGFPCTDLHLSVHGLKSSCTDSQFRTFLRISEKKSVHTVSPEQDPDDGISMLNSSAIISPILNSYFEVHFDFTAYHLFIITESARILIVSFHYPPPPII